MPEPEVQVQAVRPRRRDEGGHRRGRRLRPGRAGRAAGRRFRRPGARVLRRRPRGALRTGCGGIRCSGTWRCSRACSPSSRCTWSWRSRTTTAQAAGGQLARGASGGSSSRRCIRSPTSPAWPPWATVAWSAAGAVVHPDAALSAATVTWGRARSWTGTRRSGLGLGSPPARWWGRVRASGARVVLGAQLQRRAQGARSRTDVGGGARSGTSTGRAR